LGLYLWELCECDTSLVTTGIWLKLATNVIMAVRRIAKVIFTIQCMASDVM